LAAAAQPWIVPIPGTRRTERIVENTGATEVGLSADDLADRLGVHGNRYNNEHMALVEH
jgi:aryl-alcohol dehydrogenase-like predicted oxidoreductase